MRAALIVVQLSAGCTNTATDATGVVVSGAVILGAGGWYWLDPATALVIAVIVGYHVAKLIHKITTALRSAVVG